RIASDIKDIWALQPRFEARSSRRMNGFLEQPRFRAGLDFLLMRAEAGEVDAALGQWWLDFLAADGRTRATMLQMQTQASGGAGKKRRRRRRKSAPAADGTSAEAASSTGADDPAESAACL
ncbi:MAG: polynucleotide adenylyltransferase PcnB, partial [Candidatus Accumulibacter sp.]|nr:polynucleotide adenylyltransferase PcnB [Accumulibacter sp.]